MKRQRPPTKPFSPTFVLLSQEAHLTHGTLSTGLTALRNASFPDKPTFYLGFFNTSIALERLMKLIVVTDHMLQNSGRVPTKLQLKGYGHDLRALYASCVAAANRIGLNDVQVPTSNTHADRILSFLTDFAESTRYHNLDALSIPAQARNPLAAWERILLAVQQSDVPSAKVQVAVAQANKLHDLLEGQVLAIQHGMSGNLLSLPEVFSTPAIHQLATPYTMVHVFRLLDPLLKTVDELGHLAFYGPPRRKEPLAPLFHEFFVYFHGRSDSDIRRKKRWP